MAARVAAFELLANLVLSRVYAASAWDSSSATRSRFTSPPSRVPPARSMELSEASTSSLNMSDCSTAATEFNAPEDAMLCAKVNLWWPQFAMSDSEVRSESREETTWERRDRTRNMPNVAAGTKPSSANMLRSASSASTRPSMDTRHCHAAQHMRAMLASSMTGRT